MASTVDPTKMSQQVDLTTIPVSPGGDKGDKADQVDNSKPVTVFHDKENFNVIHPLSNTWTLWFTKPPTGKVIAPPSLISWRNNIRTARADLERQILPGRQLE